MVSDKKVEALQYIENLTSSTGEVQQKVLAEILSQNAQTEYLQRFQIGDATDPKTFKSRIPIISYEDIKPEIQRIANGDHSPILTVDPVSEFFTSSGTTGGEKKLIPITEEDWERRAQTQSLLGPIIESYVPDLDKGKGLYFWFVAFDAKTPGGLMIRSAVAKMFTSGCFKKLCSNSDAKFTSPTEAVLCTDYFQSMYAQMLCGLYYHQQVKRVGVPFASVLVRAIRFLQLNWQDLAHDIRTGSLNQKITDPSIQRAIKERLKPNPDIADLVVKECSSENWEGIIPRIWPQTKYIDAIITGTMAQYLPILEYYSGGLPMVSSICGTSECELGINLNPICKPSDISYTFMPNTAYYEFIPHEPNSPEPNLNSPLNTVDLVDVEVGKEYEIVVTTYSGLYRYQVGDVLRVTGFHNSAPQFLFARRKNVLLSIETDKTDEIELQKGIDSASKILDALKIHVMDYTSYASIKEIPGHYVIYLELLQELAELPIDDVLCECCLAIENSLNQRYQKYRSMNAIGALEIRVLKSGTFQELMEDAITKGASASQYKVPRCIKMESTIELLDSRVVSSHFSKSLPRITTEEAAEV